MTDSEVTQPSTEGTAPEEGAMPNDAVQRTDLQKRVEELINKLREEPELREQLNSNPIGTLAEQGLDVVEGGQFLFEIGYPSLEQFEPGSMHQRNAALIVGAVDPNGGGCIRTRPPGPSPTCIFANTGRTGLFCDEDNPNLANLERWNSPT